MNQAELRKYIRDVPDFPSQGILFRDITPLLRNGRAFDAALDLLHAAVHDMAPQVIVGIESRGFLFGAPLALRLGIGFVPVRKPGKLPWARQTETYSLEYGAGQLEMHDDALDRDQRVVLIDDVLATGGTAAASSRLVERIGGVVAGLAFVVELTALRGRDRLADRTVRSVLAY